MNIRTNSIVGKNGNDPVTLPFSATIPSNNIITAQGNINITTGITTVGFLSATNINITGIVTASTFIGNGSGLTIPTVTPSKSIALRYIIADHPHRS